MAWTKPTVTPKEYFQMATHKFPQRGCPVSGWEVETTETFYKQGLIAIAYINKQSKNILITFQLIGVDEISQEILNHAKDFAAHAREQARSSGCKLAYTGYSHGGSLAEHCAIQDKSPAYTFDSKPIFDETPKVNNYFSLTRYTSDKNPSTLYGNTFYVDILDHMDDALVERWTEVLDTQTELNQQD